ncbi:MAG: acyl-CoA dehydrogenase family protein [Planctomycetes bacterium]|nr:acyl-CoA dehydrogenase family protein [Planctomycetota bacterium]
MATQSIRSTASFMKELFGGNVLNDAIRPFPQPGAEEKEGAQMILEALEKYARDAIDSRAIDRSAKIPPETIDGLKELGLFGLTVPEAHGGFGATSTQFCRIMEVLTTLDPATACTVGAHTSIGIKALLYFGTEEQKAKYLPRLATGEMLAAFALTEPEAGSDAAAIRTTARPAPDGKHSILSGTKQFITNGGIADFFTVFAKILEGEEEEKGFTCLLVTRDMPGVKTGPEEEKLGIKGSSTTEVFLEDVLVPMENIVGRKGKGFKVAMEILNTGRLGLGAGSIGGSRVALALATQHAKSRKTFGQSIDNYELIQKKFARMASLLFAMESAVYLTAGLADRGQYDFSIESAICKVLCSEGSWEIINEALQVAGGYGYMKEYPFEQGLRDGRINMIFEGTNEILRLFIALSGLREQGEELKEIGKALHKPLMSLGVLLPYFAGRITRPFTRAQLEFDRPELARAVEVVNTYAVVLQECTEWVIRKHKKDVLTAQYDLERLADMAIQLFAIAASASRLDHLLSTGQDASFAKRCLDVFLFDAHTILWRSWKSLNRNCDPDRTVLSRQIVEAGGYPLKAF